MAPDARWFFVLANQAWIWILALTAVILWIIWKWRRTLFRPLAWALAGMSIATFLVASNFWWRANQSKQPLPVVSGSSDLAVEVKSKLEGYEKRADDLEKLLSLLVGMTAVYGLALGLNGYVQAEDSRQRLERIKDEAIQQANLLAARLTQIENDARQGVQKLPGEIDGLRHDAERTLNRIQDNANRQVEEFVHKVESRFPLLSDIDIGIRAIVTRITHLFPVIDWTEENYEKLRPEDKQEILYYEKAIAALEPFDLGPVRKEVSGIFHGLGNFYGVRYKTEKEKKEKGAGKPAPLEDDKERSRFYLDRSLRQDSKNVGAINDRVFFALNIDPNPQELSNARDLCHSSLSLDPEQQRARYNLAFIVHTIEKDYQQSVALLTEALSKTKWQLNEPARHYFSILYNRACAQARLGETDSALSDLEKAIPLAIPSDPRIKDQFLADIRLLKEGFQQDIEAPTPQNPLGGDLYTISKDHPQKLQEIAERLKQY
jgi:archaellum component FlaC